MISKEFVLNSEQYQIKMRVFKTWILLTLAMFILFGSIFLIMILNGEMIESALVFAYSGIIFIVAFVPGCIASYIKAKNLLNNLDTYRMVNARVKYCDQMPVYRYRYRGHITTVELEILDEYLDNPIVKTRYEGRKQTIFLKENDVIQIAYSKELDNVLFDSKY